MEEKAKKIYCGNGKQKQNGKLVSISINLDKIPAEFIKPGKNGGRYVNLDVWANDNEDQYGNSHAISVNTWKPDNTSKTDEYQAKKAVTKEVPLTRGKVDDDDELPF